jgi:hypothetical protein
MNPSGKQINGSGSDKPVKQAKPPSRPPGHEQATQTLFHAGGGHFKSRDDGCKVFFQPILFSLAFYAKKRILRYKNEPEGASPFHRHGGLRKGWKKKCTATILFLTKMCNFDK